MIKINALYFLLLIELLVIFAGLVAFLVFRERKREFVDAHTGKRDGASANHAHAPNVNPTAHDACKREIVILEEKLKEKAKLLVDLQTKLDSVEKEYMLLYQQQQAQEQEQQKN